MDANSQRLYDLGVADLTERFDAGLGLVRDPFLPERHSPHHSLWYATSLLDVGDSATAEVIVAKVLGMQELREGDPHFGNFRWHWEDEAVADLNAGQFVLEALIAMPLEKLSHELQDRVHEAMRLALEEASRLDVLTRTFTCSTYATGFWVGRLLATRRWFALEVSDCGSGRSGRGKSGRRTSSTARRTQRLI